MATYVKFPGTVGVNVATDDDNLLGSDDAHIAQSLGGWRVVTNTLVTWEQGFYAPYGAARIRLNQTSIPRFATDVAIPVTAGDYTVSMDVENLQDSDRGFALRLYVDGGSNGTENPIVVPGLSRISSTITLPAGTLDQIFIQVSGALAANEEFLVSKVVVTPGSASAFVPSLRIDGILYEERSADPPTIPVVFAGDGTPLTVGDGWSGNGYHYRRYDGPDNLAPLVAQFDAADVPVP